MIPLEYKEVRYRILRLLNEALPEWTTERLLFLGVNDAGHRVTKDEIASECLYLRQKKYIESKTVYSRVFNADIWMHRLAAPGRDLLERTAARDPGINEALE